MFKPFLEAQQYKRINLLESSNREDYIYKSMTRDALAQATAETLDFIDKTVEYTKFLRQKEQGEVKDEFREYWKAGRKE